MQHYISIAALILFIYCAFFKKINRIFRIEYKKSLNIHVSLGILCIFLFVIHGLSGIKDIKFTFGTSALIMLIGVLISGIVLKFRYGKRKTIYMIHVASCVFTMIFMIFHILYCILL